MALDCIFISSIWNRSGAIQETVLLMFVLQGSASLDTHSQARFCGSLNEYIAERQGRQFMNVRHTGPENADLCRLRIPSLARRVVR